MFKGILFLLSVLLVGFGQPAWSAPLSILAALCGFALFFYTIIDREKWPRFYLAASWFFIVQLIQLSWFTSHPYLYIYAAYIGLSLILGLQFGIIGLMVNKETLKSYLSILSVASIWTLLELSRLLIFSGFSLNPIGLSLAGNLYSLQFASLFGVYGLSFWVMLINLLLVKGVIEKKYYPWIVSALLPFIFGFAQLTYHQSKLSESEHVTALLVQTAFPVDDHQDTVLQRNTSAHVLAQWKKIFNSLKVHQGKSFDLILFPEYVVLCGTYTPAFSYSTVETLFIDTFGPESLDKLASKNLYYSKLAGSNKNYELFVNNAFIVQTVANLFNSPVLIGLEDAEDKPTGREYYSSAQYFMPYNYSGSLGRYDKRILLPLGEYIPFSWCKKLAAAYGVYGSFQPGQEAKLFWSGKLPFGASICYEETFGWVMRESRLLGAHLLVNLTSDVWYPNSLLPWQHLHHARLRTVENGAPLIRSCNVGISAGIDSFGQIVNLVANEWKEEALALTLPVYTYQTLYTMAGDSLILGISILLPILNFVLKRYNLFG